MSSRKFWMISTLIVGSYILALVLALPSAPLTDDDDFYIPAGNDYAQWIGRVVSFDRSAWSRQAIDAAFDANHEHPPVAKYVFGVAGALFSPLLGPIQGPRSGNVFLATLAAAAMLWMAVFQLGRERGLIAGGFAVALLLSIPRFFFHSRVATLDVPVAAMYTLTAAFALCAERSVRAGWLLGPVFGAATATKLNAPFFVVPYVLYVVVTRFRYRSITQTQISYPSLRMPPVPLGLLSMATLGPLTFFLVWPWMWFDTFARVSEYVRFHLGHYGIYFLYFGRLYDKDPFAPWHMPYVMAWITIPAAISVLALIGMALGGQQVVEQVGLRSWIKARLGLSTKVTENDGELASRREAEFVLWIGLHAFACISVVAFSGGAKYGGAKLFMPFFPFWSLLAGYGALRFWEQSRLLAPRKGGWIAAITLVLVVSSGFALSLRYWSVPLSQYNAFVGGLRGATAAGFERQYYDLAYLDLVDMLNERAPPNTRVHFLPNNWEYIRTFRWYLRANRVRSDLRVTSSEGTADWIVLTHERRFRRYGSDLQKLRSWEIVFEQKIDGVPLWTILRRPGVSDSVK